MFESVFAAAGIERVAVGEEGQAAPLFAEVGNDFGVIGAQEGEVAQFAEMHLDGDELALHVYGLDAGGDAEPAQLIQLAGTHRAAEVGKVNDGSFHVLLLLMALRAKRRI